MPIIKQKDWKKCQDNNKDSYGNCCVQVAKKVMEILDSEQEPVTPENVHSLFCRADEEIKAGGITGFMAGAAASMVSHCHSRGEEFRKAWNGDVGKITGQEDSKGVLNPALLNIS